MERSIRSLCRVLFGSLLVFLLGGMPLRAQLDPRLQGTKTDFLDLYQQSVNLHAKPEILTIFDFSGSMQALMFHPLYYNGDSADSGATANLSFKLNAASGSNNSYTIKAVANANSNCTTSMTITAGGGITSAGTSKAITSGTKATISAITASESSFAAGDTVTFKATVTVASDTTINWTITDGFGVVVVIANTLPSATPLNWVVPPTVSGYYVTTSLASNSIGTLTSHILVKPDGTQVSDSDAQGASTSSGMYGASYGDTDVRNWVRAASHARFTYKDGTTLRTVDFPIPWKILGSGCTGNPLSSLTVPDPVTTVTNADLTTTTYGSGTNMEMDLTYTYNGGSAVMAGDTTLQTTTSVPLVDIKKVYVDWVFTGKYPTGTGTGYDGQYVVYDAANASIVGGQGSVAWGRGFGTFGSTDVINVPDYVVGSANTPLGTYTSQPASKGVLPARSRCQAVKEAAVNTWVAFQNSVFWAYRFLDTVKEGSSSSNTKIDNKSNSNQNVAVGVPTTQQNGSDSAWTLLNGNSVNGIKRLASLFPNNGTPLTYAIARGLAQFTDPNSVFNSVETGKDVPSQCMNHFLILFTDGVDNNNSGTNNTNEGSPYIAADGTGNAKDGNTALIANKTAVIPVSGTWWNVFTFAGASAHLADVAQGTVGTNYMAAPTSYTSGPATPDYYLPYAIKSRNGVSYSKDHRITTMTVGVSLGGVFSDTSSPKRHLFLAAATGDATTTSWNINNLQPWTADPLTGLRIPNSTNFFDATNPQALVASLKNAFTQAVLSPNINETAEPNLPYVGASFGDEVYLGKFTPPANGGAIWTGDLLMFDTKVVNNQTIIIDNLGNTPTTLDNTTSQWSAAQTLYATPWTSRNLFTRLPGTATTPEPGLTPFTDVDTTANNNAFTKIKPYVATAFTTDALKKSVIQFVAGGDITGKFDTSTPPRPLNNRTTIMGDIINSAPAAQEYNYSDLTNGNLKPPSGLPVGSGNRFRLILVGTNQGFLHAFGEVTTASPVKDSSGTVRNVVTGSITELWAFLPTDFLANLNALTVPTNTHRFMVDGSPSIYFLDLPPSGGGQGNGVVDNSTPHERAVAVIGLRKGGRSYYALDIHDPFNPSMLWSLVPDEVAAQGSFPASRILDTSIVSASTVYKIVSNFGFSTSTPSFGRIFYKGVLHDAVFLGGGLSAQEIEINFPKDTNGNYPALGRSMIALDVYSGKVLAAVDMTATNISGTPTYTNKFLTSLGPISANAVPFEYFLGSGMAQRCYFMDDFGGLWAMGSKQLDTGTTSSTNKYRIDSSDLTLWTKDGTQANSGNAFSVRKVYQDNNPLNVYTASPAPFRVGTFPGAGKTASLATPSAVGVAMVSGDRNNPLDYLYPTGSMPSQYRVTVVFDRQDSAQWGLDTTTGPDAGIHDSGTSTELLDATNFKETDSTPAPDLVTPGKATYYLNPTSGTPYFGYYINFPGKDAKNFIPKGINTPIVASGSLFYTYFWPDTADPCTGGSGSSYSQIVCDVYNPVSSDTRTSGIQCLSGNKFTWSGVSSDYVAFGTTGAIQGGVVVLPGGGTNNGSATTLQLETLIGRTPNLHPKARVWRTVPRYVP